MKKFLVALSVCAVFSFAGCIDRDFELTDVSGEMTVGGEELIVPLTTIDNIYISDLLKDNEQISNDSNGVYRIAFSSFGDEPDKYETISIDGIEPITIKVESPELQPLEFSFQEIPQSLHLSKITQKFNTEIPSIGTIMRVDPIKFSQSLNLGLPGIISGKGTLPEYLVPNESFTCSNSSEIVFNANLNIMEHLKRVDWVWFGSDEDPYGAPFTISVDMNGLQDINGGGELSLKVEFPQGYYLRHEDGTKFPEETHNILDTTINLNQRDKICNYVVYLDSIYYGDHEFVNGELNIEDHIKYNYNLELKLCSGNYNLSALPKFSISAGDANNGPEYKDVEIVINHFEVPAITETLSYTFDGLPSAISVEKVAFSEDTELTMTLQGLEWLQARDYITKEPISPYVEIVLPKCMHFRTHELLDNATNTLTAPIEALSQGVKLSLADIDCTAEGVSQDMGQLTINNDISANIHLEVLDGHTVLASELTPPANTNVVFSIKETNLKLDTANTNVKWNEDSSFEFKGDQIPSFSETIAVPEMISSIDNIAICKLVENNLDNNDEPFSITFSFGKMAGTTFPVDELEVDVVVNLGKLLRPTEDMFTNKIIQKNNNGDNILVIKELWKPNEKNLTKSISFDALENIPDIVDGKISINQSFPVTGSIKIKSGEDINLSTNSAKVDVDVKIDDIKVKSFTGAVDINVAPEEMVVELDDIGDLGVQINSLSINPILNVTLKDNPTGMPFKADIALTTFDKDGKQLYALNVPEIAVNATGPSKIVISTPRNAADYQEPEFNFVGIEELSKLLSNGLPAKIAVKMSVSSDKAEHTINLADVADGYKFQYQYEVILPFEFDGDVDIAYESSVSGMNEMFANLADNTQGLKVGDVGLVTEFATTIPFNIVVSAWLVNADGTTENIGAKLDIKNCLINGHNPANGKQSISKLDLDFDLGESQSLEGLRNADGIKFKFSLYNSDNNIADLSADQYLNGKLKLRIREGLTVDIFELLNKEE